MVRVTGEATGGNAGWKFWQRVPAATLTTTAFGAVALAFVMVASYLVVRTEARSEFDLQLSDGAVWLSSTELGGVSLLDGGSGTIVASLGVANPGDDFSVEQWGSDAIIVNRTDGTVSRLDGAVWNIATGRVQFGDAGQPLDVVTGDEDGWVMTAGQATPLGFDEMTARPAIPVAAPFADGVINENGDLLYASTDPTRPVLRFLASGGAPEPIPGVDGPTALADLGRDIAGVDLDDRVVWVEGQGITCEALEFPADTAVNAGGADGRMIAVSDQGGAFVWDPTTGCPGSEDFISLGSGTYGPPMLTDGWAVVPETSQGEVVVLDLEERSIISRQALEGVEPGTPIDLIGEGSSIWYNDPSSASAGLIQPDGTVIAVAKYEDGVDGFTAAPIGDGDDDLDDLGVAGEANALNEEEPDDIEPTESTTTTVAEEEEESGTDDTEPTVPPAGPTVTPAPTDPVVTQETTDTSDGNGGTDPTTDTTDGTTATSEETSTTEGTTTTTEPEGVAITIGVSASQILEGETINFTAVTQHGSPNNWESDVSPSGPSLQPLEDFGSFRYRFDTAGTYIVSITACDPDRNCDTGRVQVTVTEDPDAIDVIAGFAGPTTAEELETVSFTDASQGDPTSWEWDFGTDANPATSTEQNPSVAWASPGQKTVTLTVRNGSRSDSFTSTIDVTSVLICPAVVPTPDISGPAALVEGESGTFTDTVTPDGGCIPFPTYSWSADGGATISNPAGRTTAISWANAGTYRVTLRWTDGGQFQSAGFDVTVAEAAPTEPAPNISINGPATVDAGQTANFNVTNTGGAITSYSWSTSGGGGSGSGDTFAASWTGDGGQSVILDVSGPGGTDSFTFVIQVNEPSPQTAPFGISCNQSTAVTDQIFSCDLTTGDPGNFSNPSWSVGPASALSWLMSEWSYDAAGTVAGSTVTVTLTAIDIGTGQTVTSSASVSITAPTTTTQSVPALGLSCSPSTRPADGVSAATCDISNAGEFSNISYSVNNPQGLFLNQWGAPGQQFVASDDPGSVTVTATATHVGTGQTVNAGAVTITFTTVETTTTTTAPPVPQPFGVSCNVGSATVGQRFNCSLSTGNQGAFSGPSWSISPAAGTLSWGQGPFSIDVQGTAAGTVTVSLSATDIATGQPVFASATVTIN